MHVVFASGWSLRLGDLKSGYVPKTWHICLSLNLFLYLDKLRVWSIFNCWTDMLCLNQSFPTAIKFWQGRYTPALRLYHTPNSIHIILNLHTGAGIENRTYSIFSGTAGRPWPGLIWFHANHKTPQWTVGLYPDVSSRLVCHKRKMHSHARCFRLWVIP